MEKKRTILIVGGASGSPLASATTKALEDSGIEVILVDTPKPPVRESPPLLEIPIFNFNKDSTDFDKLDLFDDNKPSVAYTPKRGKGKKGVKRKKR